MSTAERFTHSLSVRDNALGGLQALRELGVLSAVRSHHTEVRSDFVGRSSPSGLVEVWRSATAAGSGDGNAAVRVSRRDLWRELYDRALALGATVRFGKQSSPMVFKTMRSYIVQETRIPIFLTESSPNLVTGVTVTSVDRRVFFSILSSNSLVFLGFF